MRRIVTAITGVALAFSLVAMAAPAANAAVPGYDSAYAGESAFLNLQPGQTGTFTVFFANTGTTSWVKGTASQVDLAACLENKTTCNAQDASEAAFNSGWLSATRYTTQTQATVAPGQVGTFTYSVKVPADAAAGTYRFNGALVLAATGADIHNEGYYQDVTVAVAVAAENLDLTPSAQFKQVGQTATLTLSATDADGDGQAGVAITCNIDSPPIGVNPTATTGNPDMQVTGVTNASGDFTLVYSRDNVGTDVITCYSDADPTVRDTATVQWGIPAVPLAVTPDTAETKAVGECRTYTVKAFNPYTGDPLTPDDVADFPELQLYANFTQNFAAPTGIDKDAGSTISDLAGNSGSPTPTTSILVMTDANGVAVLTICGVGVATLTPVVFNNQSGGNVNTIQAGDLSDTGGTLTVGIIVVATITPSAATNPTSTGGTTSVSTFNLSAGEETFTISLTQAGDPFLVPNPYTVIFSVKNNGVDTLVYIVNCNGTNVSTAIIGGATGTCTATILAGSTASVTVDSGLVGSATITATATSTASPFAQSASNTATKSWVTTSSEDTAFTAGQSRSGTVTSVEKGSTLDCAGSYILTVGTTAYLITYDPNDSFVVGGVTFLGLPSCTQFEASLSAGDLLTFTNVGADPASVDIHNITQDNP